MKLFTEILLSGNAEGREQRRTARVFFRPDAWRTGGAIAQNRLKPLKTAHLRVSGNERAESNVMADINLNAFASSCASRSLVDH